VELGAEDCVWVRGAFTRGEDDRWDAAMLELLTDEAPPNWATGAWRYPSARFVATVEGGEAVAGWLTAGFAEVDGIEGTLPQLSTSLAWDRRQSGAEAIFESLMWPATEAQLAQGHQYQSDWTTPLLSDEDAPSFVNFASAAASFFSLMAVPTGGTFHHGIVIRRQDQVGRIDRIEVAPNAVTVDLVGEALDGLTVDLAGDVPGQSIRIWDRRREGRQVVTFDLDDGLPPGAWVVLRRGSEWKDRRFLAMPWSGQLEAGVDVVIDPVTRLEGFLAGREGARVEFKRQAPEDQESKRKLMKTVCAFANGDGGSVLFGVDDDHEVVGLAVQSVDDVKDQLTSTVMSWLEPVPTIDFHLLPLENGHLVVLEMTVDGGDRLYASGLPSEARRPYVRHHATSVPARPGEIEEIVRRRSSQASRPWPT
jgi:hypothetical protein